MKDEARKLAEKRSGASKRTLGRDSQILSDVRQFPSLESWSQGNIKRTAEALRQFQTREEQKDAERFAATFDKSEGNYAADALENMVDNVVFDPKLRKEIWRRAKSSKPEEVQRAQTTAASLHAPPEDWYGQLKDCLKDLAEVVKKRKKRDWIQGRLRDAHKNLEQAVDEMQRLHSEVYADVMAELKGKAK